MSYREKSAWISFICLLLLTLGVVHSQHFHTHDAQGNDVINPLHLALAIFVGFLVLQVVLHLIVRAQAPKAARIGFYSLVVGELSAMAAFHAHGRPGLLMWTILLAILISWLIKLGTEIVLYRRG